ncbi:MAG: flagellar hook-associated protein FlgK [Rhodospirillaceae bacterium]|nr:flagellar hook-associated protein FlgK [Rhodospirillaceae bacterium]
MSLTASLNSSLAGLRAAQAGIDVVAQNVANATTPGYTRKSAPLESQVNLGVGTGVQRGEIIREVDLRVLRELQTERGNTENLRVISEFLANLDQFFGRPEDEVSVASAVNDLSTALAALADTPEDTAVQRSAVTAADQLAGNLNRLSDAVQSLRQDADDAIRADVDEINQALAEIEDLNLEIAARERTGRSSADLQDRRDVLVGEIAGRMDIQTFTRGGNELVILTASGRTLLDVTARELVFDGRGPMTPDALYNTDASLRGVGTVMLVDDSGSYDLLARGEISSGSIAGYVELRDRLLPEAQDQLDELAHQLALALGAGVVPGTPVTRTTATTLADGTYPFDGLGDKSGNAIQFTIDGVTYSAGDLPIYAASDPGGADAAVEAAIRAALDDNGFEDIEVAVATVGTDHEITFSDPGRHDITGLTFTGSAAIGSPATAATIGPDLSTEATGIDVANIVNPGDSLTVTWRDPATEQPMSITLKAVRPPAEEADQFVLGATAGSTAVTVAQKLAGLLPEGLEVSLSGTVLTFSDADVDANTPNLMAVSITGQAAADTSLPVFADGEGTDQITYTGLDGSGSAKRGFAQRIAVSDGILDDPTALVRFAVDAQGTLSDSGDPTHVLDMLDRLTSRTYQLDGGLGLGSRELTIEDLSVAIVSFQSNQAADQEDRYSFQDGILESVERRFDDQSGVNIDEEMSDLLLLEQSYNASSQILTAVQSMFDALLQAIR